MLRVTLKTSTIFIGKGKETRVYSSLGEIPKDLQRELQESTNGFNSATILIADRRGREELHRALSGLPSVLRSRLVTSLQAANTAQAAKTGHAADGESAEPPAVPDEQLTLAWAFNRFRWTLGIVGASTLALVVWAVSRVF